MIFATVLLFTLWANGVPQPALGGTYDQCVAAMVHYRQVFKGAVSVGCFRTFVRKDNEQNGDAMCHLMNALRRYQDRDYKKIPCRKLG